MVARELRAELEIDPRRVAGAREQHERLTATTEIEIV
jgi:hypothetical protein